MTFKAMCLRLSHRVFIWLTGVAMWALGAYVLVQKIAIWPGIGLITFGTFLLMPKRITAFAKWIKANAADYFSKPRGA